MRMRVVMATTETRLLAPWKPCHFLNSVRKREAERLEAKILTNILPMRMVISRLLGFERRCATRRDRLFFSAWNFLTLTWLREKRAVSEPEKKADRASRIRIAKTVYCTNSDLLRWRNCQEARYYLGTDSGKRMYSWSLSVSVMYLSALTSTGTGYSPSKHAVQNWSFMSPRHDNIPSLLR